MFDSHSIQVPAAKAWHVSIHTPTLLWSLTLSMMFLSSENFPPTVPPWQHMFSSTEVTQRGEGNKWSHYHIHTHKQMKIMGRALLQYLTQTWFSLSRRNWGIWVTQTVFGNMNHLYTCSSVKPTVSFADVVKVLPKQWCAGSVLGWNDFQNGFFLYSLSPAIILNFQYNTNHFVQTLRLIYSKFQVETGDNIKLVNILGKWNNLGNLFSNVICIICSYSSNCTCNHTRNLAVSKVDSLGDVLCTLFSGDGACGGARVEVVEAEAQEAAAMEVIHQHGLTFPVHI